MAGEVPGAEATATAGGAEAITTGPDSEAVPALEPLLSPSQGATVTSALIGGGVVPMSTDRGGTKLVESRGGCVDESVGTPSPIEEEELEEEIALDSASAAASNATATASAATAAAVAAAAFAAAASSLFLLPISRSTSRSRFSSSMRASSAASLRGTVSPSSSRETEEAAAAAAAAAAIAAVSAAPPSRHGVVALRTSALRTLLWRAPTPLPPASTVDVYDGVGAAVREGELPLLVGLLGVDRQKEAGDRSSAWEGEDAANVADDTPDVNDEDAAFESKAA